MSWSSSTTRTRIPSRTSLSLCSPGLVAWGPESGSSTVKVAPFSSPGLSTRTRPPWSSTTCFTTASSSPAAPYALPEVCAGGDTSKTCGRKSELIPFPLSITWIRAQAPARSKWTPTRPPSGVNLIAFASRVATTWSSRCGSTTSVLTDWSRAASSRINLCSARGRSASIEALIKRTGSTARRSRRSSAVAMHERSSRSSMSFASARTLRSIASIARARSSSRMPFERRTCTQVSVEASGVFSSCETRARNSSFARFADSLGVLGAGAQHHDEGAELRSHHREHAQVPHFVRAFGAADEQDPDHLVEPEERNGEVRPGQCRGRFRRMRMVLDQPREQVQERLREQGSFVRRRPRHQHEARLVPGLDLEQRALFVRHEPLEELEHVVHLRSLRRLEDVHDVVERTGKKLPAAGLAPSRRHGSFAADGTGSPVSTPRKPTISLPRPLIVSSFPRGSGVPSGRHAGP